MKVTSVAIDLLHQLKDIVDLLSPEEYNRPLEILGNSSIAAHNRHSIEFFQMLFNGIDTGCVCYDNRLHNKDLESNIPFIVSEINNLCCKLESQNQNLKLNLKVSYPQSEISTELTTSIEREIIYNIEHLVHHMAIVKIGLKVSFPHVVINKSFGIAQSTIKYQESLS